MDASTACLTLQSYYTFGKVKITWVALTERRLENGHFKSFDVAMHCGCLEVACTIV